MHYFCFRSYSQSFGQQSLTFHTQDWAGFFQDDWRATQRLTIHAGLRFEYQFLPLPQQPNAALDAVFGAVGATSVFPEDRNNFGPRLGVAWQPFGVGRGVLRIGYGVYFGKLPGATIRAALLDYGTTQLHNAGAHSAHDRDALSAGYDGRLRLRLLVPHAADGSRGRDDLGGRLRPAISSARSPAGNVFHRAWAGCGSAGPRGLCIEPRPATAQLGGHQHRSLDRRADFQLQGGTGAIGVRDGETFAVPVYTARVTPSFGPVTDLVSNANASYHGLTLEARRGMGAASARPQGYIGVGRAGWTSAWRGPGPRRSTLARARARCRAPTASSTPSRCATTRASRR